MFLRHSHPDPLCFTPLVPMFLRPLTSRSIVLHVACPMFLRPLASRSIVLHAACPYVLRALTSRSIVLHAGAAGLRRDVRWLVDHPPKADTELLPIESFQWRSVMLVLFNIRRLYCLLRPFLTAMLVKWQSLRASSWSLRPPAIPFLALADVESLAGTSTRRGRRREHRDRLTREQGSKDHDACTLRMWLCMKWHCKLVHGCTVVHVAPAM